MNTEYLKKYLEYFYLNRSIRIWPTLTVLLDSIFEF